MTGLVVATCVVAIRERNARAKAVKELAPQPLDIEGGESAADDGVQDGFGDVDGGFDADGGDDFAALDESSFK